MSVVTVLTVRSRGRRLGHLICDNATPYQMPKTLTDDEVYAPSANILSRNKLIGENGVMNAQTLPKVKMPNADNFIIRFPARI